MLYGDSVPAGPSSTVEDFLDMDLNLHDFWLKIHQIHLVKAIGNSMIDANINSGDVMIVDKAIKPQNNDIVLAMLDGEFAVKHIRINENQLYLM